MRAEAKIKMAYDIVRNYSGENTHIQYLKDLVVNHGYVLNEFDVQYVLANHSYKPVYLNRIVHITDFCGQRIQKECGIEFTPEKLKIIWVIGEMGQSYHCFAQFRQSLGAVPMFLSRRDLKDELLAPDYDNCDVDFEAIDNMAREDRKLRDHQKTAVKFLVGNRKAILADSMGLGKTTSSIAASIAASCKKILVVTTASLKSTWRKELTLYFDDSEIEVVKPLRKFKGGCRYTIINYDLFQKYYEVPSEPVFEEVTELDDRGLPVTKTVPVMVKSKSTGKQVQKVRKSRKKDVIERCLNESKLIQERYDCIIIDEVQKLSKSGTIRYSAIEDFIKRSKISNVYLLTGTPLTNKPINLYYILNLIGAEITQDYKYYVTRYCDGREITVNGKKIMLRDGHSHLDELRDRIRHLYMRRLISDLPDMVKKVVSARYYYLTPQQTVQYDQLWGEYMDVQSHIERPDGRSPEEWKQLVEGGLVRKFLANEMVPNTITLVNELLEDEDKVIIVCTYQHEVDAFMKYFGKRAVCYDGRMSVKQKDEAEQSFKTNPKVKVFVGNINAASLGLTLTVAKKMVFNSYSWEEIANRQMQDRIWRITQTEDVECIYQLWTDSISQHMYESVIQKGCVMDTVIKSENTKRKRISSGTAS